MKRMFDCIFAGTALLLSSPLLLALAIVIICVDGRPIFFHHWRVGRHGKMFRMHKFRTMHPGAEKRGASITKAGDSRVTWLGSRLRRTKLDELPQLWNVLCGEMSMVGPRPEVSKYVELYDPRQRRVLGLTPGITDLASIAFRDEEKLLASSADPERFYIEHCMPQKIRLNLEYAGRATVWTDLGILLRTAAEIIRPSSRNSVNIRDTGGSPAH